MNTLRLADGTVIALLDFGPRDAETTIVLGHGWTQDHGATPPCPVAVELILPTGTAEAGARYVRCVRCGERSVVRIVGVDWGLRHRGESGAGR